VKFATTLIIKLEAPLLTTVTCGNRHPPRASAAQTANYAALPLRLENTQRMFCANSVLVMKTFRNGLKVAQFIVIQPRMTCRYNPKGDTNAAVIATG
jgi:hypothetical protein